MNKLFNQFSLFLHFQDGFVQNVHIPIVRVDPENRCAVMLVYGTQLVVLPFRKDTLTDEQEGGVGEGYACSPLYILLTNACMSFPQGDWNLILASLYRYFWQPY